MEKWNGQERRGNSRDHDLLTKIDANLSNFMSRFEEHKKDDEAHFERLYKGQALLKKYLYVAIGIIAAIQFFDIFKR